ncbi:uncharacterized protein LAJ45_02318 [Morchella importuna]|uniref:uncharacterized protein n=1 Tax=Morchella importuna TaxID=1174673 RepID=UPI001E8E8CFF|nr:uncharacterized protein LAJ45_02318 [Morchella importuna]KAH8153505.1 hypothetical protein LAJ45_02318 [Morchella importuna]
MSDQGYRYPRPYHYDNDGPGPSRPSKRPRDQMSMARLNNASNPSSSIAAAAPGPSLILPTRNGSWSNNTTSNNNNNINNNNNSNGGASRSGNTSRVSPTRSSSSSQTLPNGHTVIDLTNSPPPPQQEMFGPREVIDVDALPDTPALPPRWPGGNVPEFRFSRNAANRLLGVFAEEMEGPVLGHGGRIGQGLPDVNMGGIGNFLPRFRSGPQGGQQGVHGGIDVISSIWTSFGSRGMWGHDGPLAGFQAPDMDYSQRAPGIIREESPVDAARARNIDYKSPQPAREGYTRSPKEDDILVCSSCSSELGVPGEGPYAQEVWASKCGHSYCGTCVSIFRTPPLSKSKKPVRPKAKNCSVGCKVNLATKTAMFKIHL